MLQKFAKVFQNFCKLAKVCKGLQSFGISIIVAANHVGEVHGTAYS